VRLREGWPTGPDDEPLSEHLAVLIALTRARIAAEQAVATETRQALTQIKQQQQEQEGESMPGCHHCRDLTHGVAPYCRCPCHDKETDQ